MALGTFSTTVNGSSSDLTIAAASTTICTAVTGLSSAVALLASFHLDYGAGSGGTVRAYLQTTLDSTTWVDIACVLFGTAAKTVILNFSALTPKLTQVVPTNGTLTDDTAIDGIIGSKIRVKVVSTGVYSGATTLIGRIVVR